MKIRILGLPGNVCVDVPDPTYVTRYELKVDDHPSFYYHALPEVSASGISLPLPSAYLQSLDLGALSKIRARRDEIGRDSEGMLGEDEIDFWRLFDDGAEFGPDRVEPKYQFQVRGNDSSAWVNVVKDGEGITSLSVETFNAIKRLGADEVGE